MLATLFNKPYLMKKIYYMSLALYLSVSACKKAANVPEPVADFSFDRQKSATITVAENNIFIFQNDSQNASSYYWDFGNGTTSTERNPKTEFQNAGVYAVTLTVKNNSGNTAATKKEIKVVVPVMKTITIKDLDLNSKLLPDVPVMNKADVWVEVKVKDSSIPDKVLNNGTTERSLFYKTAIYSNAVSNNAPIIFKVLKKQALVHYFLDKKYSFELYGRNASGTYLLSSTDFIGSTFLGDIEANKFSWVSSTGSTIEIIGSYE